MRPLLLTALITLLASAKAQPVRVLFIGNSYTYSNDLPGMLDSLATAMGEDVVTGMSAPGGYTFSQHTQLAYTQQLLAQGDWDYVVLQEQSQLPAFPLAQVEAQCFPYAAQLVQQARQANPCTEAVFLMTWGRENGDAQNCPSWPPVCTYEGMQQLLHERYLQMATGNDAWCAPVGAVWSSWRAEFPGSALYTDGSHPNALGTYIAAATLASTIFRRPCTAADWAPATLAPGQALEVRTRASEAVLDEAAAWNIGVNDPSAAPDWMLLGGNEACFGNNGTPGAVLEWHFGDGATNTEESPCHTYSGAGPFEGALVATDGCGRADTAAFTIEFPSGIGSATSTAPLLIRFDGEGRLIAAAQEPVPFFELLDAGGRLIERRSLRAGLTVLRGGGGLLWRARCTDGSWRAGRVAQP
ncbi:MAG: PKD domain-containing protein [Flavobacteriales bacterium]|nr:MAG: PKD domain-containing protein [Flavobacteriales bacterium]